MNPNRSLTHVPKYVLCKPTRWLIFNLTCFAPPIRPSSRWPSKRLIMCQSSTCAAQSAKLHFIGRVLPEILIIHAERRARILWTTKSYLPAHSQTLAWTNTRFSLKGFVQNLSLPIYFRQGTPITWDYSPLYTRINWFWFANSLPKRKISIWSRMEPTLIGEMLNGVWSLLWVMYII